VYVGCYADVINSNTRDLNGVEFNNSIKVAGGSVETCVAFCLSKNFSYAGVQNGFVFRILN